MERYIGMDAHAVSCTLAVISEKGRKLKDFPIETNGQALVEAIRMIPGHKQKNEKRDAYGLAERLRVGDLDKIVFKAEGEGHDPRMSRGQGHRRLACAGIAARLALTQNLHPPGETRRAVSDPHRHSRPAVASQDGST